jgi:hypothetical protein
MPISDADPPVTSARRGIRLRHVDDGKRSYFEVEHPGEVERIKDRLSAAEYEAGIMLRHLWSQGTLNPEAQSSALDRLDMPRTGFAEHEDEHRLEAQDELRAALRSMGMMGMSGRLAVEIVIYERRVRSQAMLLHLREALSRLAEHLRSVSRRAA